MPVPNQPHRRDLHLFNLAANDALPELPRGVTVPELHPDADVEFNLRLLHPVLNAHTNVGRHYIHLIQRLPVPEMLETWVALLDALFKHDRSTRLSSSRLVRARLHLLNQRINNQAYRESHRVGNSRFDPRHVTMLDLEELLRYTDLRVMVRNDSSFEARNQVTARQASAAPPTESVNLGIQFQNWVQGRGAFLHARRVRPVPATPTFQFDTANTESGESTPWDSMLATSPDSEVLMARSEQAHALFAEQMLTGTQMNFDTSKKEPEITCEKVIEFITTAKLTVTELRSIANKCYDTIDIQGEQND